jgi:hypothetical protein
MGAITPLFAGCAPETAQANGKVCHSVIMLTKGVLITRFVNPTQFDLQFFAPWGRESTPRSDHINNTVAEDKLIAWLEEQIRVQNIL